MGQGAHYVGQLYQLLYKKLKKHHKCGVLASRLRFQLEQLEVSVEEVPVVDLFEECTE